MGKYDPLRRYLQAHSEERITLGFDEIADLVGGLPPSAYDHQAWWANTRSHPNAVAWLDAGWMVESHDLRRRRVTLHKAIRGERPHRGRSKPSSSTPRQPRSSRTRPDVRRRVTTLIEEFEPLLDYYDTSLPFARSGQYENHRRTIDRRYQAGSVAAALDDDRWLRLLYDTLWAWGIGKRASRIVPLEAFAAELRSWSRALSELDGLKIDTLGLNTAAVGRQLWDLVEGIDIIANRARLVALSKTIHHLLPDLLPPIDRMYTQEFFGFYPADFQDRQQKTFLRIWEEFVIIAQAARSARFVGAGWRTSRTKVIDNAIVAFVHRPQGGIESDRRRPDAT